MKKTLVALMAVAVASMGLSASAADNDKKCDKKDCKATERKCNGQTQECNAPNPFEGLNLTAEQQAKIDDLKAQCQKDRKDGLQQAKEQKKADKAARRECSRQQRTKMLADIKNILTPEQYVQFLENNFINQTHGKPMKPGKGAKQGKAPRGGKDMKRPDRPVRADQPSLRK